MVWDIDGCESVISLLVECFIVLPNFKLRLWLDQALLLIVLRNPLLVILIEECLIWSINSLFHSSFAVLLYECLQELPLLESRSTIHYLLPMTLDSKTHARILNWWHLQFKAFHPCGAVVCLLLIHFKRSLNTLLIVLLHLGFPRWFQ